MTCARDQFPIRIAGALAAFICWLIPPILWAAPAMTNGPASAVPRTSSGTGHKVVLAPARPSAEVLQYALTPRSTLRLKGTATIGNWSSRSKKVLGFLTVYSSQAALDQLFHRIATARPNKPLLLKIATVKAPIGKLSIPVVSLHGGNSGMDHDMWHALNAAAHPTIRYAFSRVVCSAVRWNRHHNRWHLKLAVMGKLTLAGVTRKLRAIMRIYPESHGQFYIHSSTVVMMRDFGVTPPTAFFGLIRGHNRVHVIFDLHLMPERHNAHFEFNK